MASEVSGRRVIIVDGEPMGHLLKAYLTGRRFVEVVLVRDLTDFPDHTLYEQAALFLVNGDCEISGAESHEGRSLVSEILGAASETAPIIVYAIGRRTGFVGHLERECPELREGSWDGVWHFISLPARVEEIDRVIDLAAESSSNPEILIKRRQLRSSMAARLAIAQDISQRHTLTNALAAARILNGAIRSGDYPIADATEGERIRAAYVSILENSSEESIELKKQDAERTIRYSVNELRSKGAGASRVPWHKHIERVLVVDDQRGIWEPVWKYIFGAAKVTFVENGAEALETVKKVAFDLVILDVDLGEGRENGLEVVQRFKHQQFELPVLIVTAFDDSQLVKQSLQNGAESYFVKELSDFGDRDSVSYYKQLKETVERVVHQDSRRERRRKLWRAFQEKEAAMKAVDELHSTRIGQFLTRAYYLMTLEEDDYLPRALLLSMQERANYRYAVMDYEKAVDEILFAKLGESPQLGERNLGDLYSPKVTGVGEAEKPAYPNVSARWEKVFGEKWDGLKYLRRMSAKARHHSGGMGFDGSEKCFRAVLEAFSRAGLKSKPSVGRDAGGFRPTACVLVRRHTSKRAHAEKGLDSARLLEEGFEDSKGKHGLLALPTKSRMGRMLRILWIDDEGEESAWYGILREIASWHRWELDVWRSLPEDFRLERYDFVLLDLFFAGNAEKGLEILQAIKLKDVSIPVVMLTGESSAVYCRRALMRGADEYFVKDPRGMNASEYYEKFSGLLKAMEERCESRERELWRRINAVREKEVLPHLRAGYFFYLMDSRPSAMRALWRVNRLFSSPLRELVFSCALAVEARVRRGIEKKKTPGVPDLSEEDTGWLIRTLKYEPDAKRVFQNVWNLRNSFKEGKEASVDAGGLLFKVVDGLMRCTSVTYDFGAAAKLSPGYRGESRQWNKRPGGGVGTQQKAVEKSRKKGFVAEKADMAGGRKLGGPGGGITKKAGGRFSLPDEVREKLERLRDKFSR